MTFTECKEAIINLYTFLIFQFIVKLRDGLV